MPLLAVLQQLQRAIMLTDCHEPPNLLHPLHFNGCSTQERRGGASSTGRAPRREPKRVPAVVAVRPAGRAPRAGVQRLVQVADHV